MKSYFHLSVSVSLIMLFLISCTGSSLTSTQDGDDTDGDEPVDGDVSVDGDTTDGDTTDGDTTDSDTTDGDDEPIDGDAPTDGDTIDGDDLTDGDTTDGDTTDGDTTEADEDTCTTHSTYTCDHGDVYWYDSCGNREEKKEDCVDCTCTGNSCMIDTQYKSQCAEGDVYWFDCKYHRADKKEECYNCSCSYGNACVYDSQYSTMCYDDDVYWVDCYGEPAEKKEECEPDVCTGGKCRLFYIDPTTGLDWQEELSEDEEFFLWDDAKTHCEDLTLDGGGWRLPNISELRSLIRDCPSNMTGGVCGVMDECAPCGVGSDDVCLLSTCSSDCEYCEGGGSIGCYWPEALSGPCQAYWSSSPKEDSDNSAWGVVFYYGSMMGLPTNDYFLVRCVR